LAAAVANSATSIEDSRKRVIDATNNLTTAEKNYATQSGNVQRTQQEYQKSLDGVTAAKGRLTAAEKAGAFATRASGAAMSVLDAAGGPLALLVVSLWGLSEVWDAVVDSAIDAERAQKKALDMGNKVKALVAQNRATEGAQIARAELKDAKDRLDIEEKLLKAAESGDKAAIRQLGQRKLEREDNSWTTLSTFQALDSKKVILEDAKFQVAKRKEVYESQLQLKKEADEAMLAQQKKTNADQIAMDAPLTGKKTGTFVSPLASGLTAIKEAGSYRKEQEFLVKNGYKARTQVMREAEESYKEQALKEKKLTEGEINAFSKSAGETAGRVWDEANAKREKKAGAAGARAAKQAERDNQLAQEVRDRISEEIDIKKALENVKGRYIKEGRAILICAYSTGARPNELLKIKAKDITRDGNNIHIKLQGSKNGLPRELILSLKKLPMAKELYDFAASTFPEMILFNHFISHYERTRITKKGIVKKYIETTDSFRYHI